MSQGTPSQFTISTALDTIRDHLAAHMQAFHLWLVAGGKSPSTAGQYVNMLSSMYKQGDVRKNEDWEWMVTQYNPSTHGTRNSARKLYFDFIGILRPQEGPDTSLTKARAGKVRRQLQAAIEAYMASFEAGYQAISLADLVQLEVTRYEASKIVGRAPPVVVEEIPQEDGEAVLDFDTEVLLDPQTYEEGRGGLPAPQEEPAPEDEGFTIPVPKAKVGLQDILGRLRELAGESASEE